MERLRDNTLTRDERRLSHRDLFVAFISRALSAIGFPRAAERAGAESSHWLAKSNSPRE